VHMSKLRYSQKLATDKVSKRSTLARQPSSTSKTLE
jgi:hypothetical protein